MELWSERYRVSRLHGGISNIIIYRFVLIKQAVHDGVSNQDASYEYAKTRNHVLIRSIMYTVIILKLRIYLFSENAIVSLII